MNKVKKVPRLIAKLAKSHNKSEQGLTAGRGVKILKTRGRTIVERDATAALTQAEFNAMLNVAIGLDTRGELEDMAYDMAILAIEWWFSFYDETTIDVCGLGSVIFVTT